MSQGKLSFYRKPTAILSAAITTALACMLAPPLSQAAEGFVLEEIVVTAQRREQNLQEVPISVTAFSGEALAKSNLKSATEYLALTPNVSFTEDGQTGSRGLGISIRGINNLISGENAFINSVGIYLDEFSVASVPNQVANPQIPDMERIEVLRGPQGTYFGRNSLGGALNLTTKAPSNELEGSISAGFEDFDNAGDQWSFTGILNLPVSDNFAVRGVYYHEDSDGLVENVCKAGASAAKCPAAAENGFTPNGEDDSGHEYDMFRLKVRWNVSDSTEIDATFIYTDEEQGTDENVPSGVMDLDTRDTFSDSFAAGVFTGVDPGTGFWPNNRNELSHDIDEHTDNESTVGIIKIQHQLNDNVVIKSITGFIDAEVDRLFDNDLIGGLDLLKRNNLYEGFSWSTELRVEVTNDAYDFIAGILYAEDDQEQENNVAVSTQPTATFNGVGFLPPFPTGLGLALNEKNFEVESLAIFIDYTWHVNDRLDLTLGARYTHDDVLNELDGFAAVPTCCFPPDDVTPPTAAFFQSFTNIPREPASDEQSFDDIAPRFVVRYQLTNDVNIYGTISKGYKAGGTSLGNNTNAPGQPAFTVPFDEETLWNYEAGIKAELFDRRVRFNAAVYHLEWKDLQMESFRFLTPGDLSSNFEQTINIKDAEADGIEIEVIAAVTEGLTLSATLGYQDTEITSNTVAEITGSKTVNLKGLEIPKAPELTTSFTGEYRWPIADNELWVRVEYIYRDEQYSDIEGLTNKQHTPGLNNEFPYLAPDYELVNLRAGFDTENVKVSLFIQNLTDEEYYTGTQENFGISGIRLRPHPQIIGGSVTYSF